MDRWSSSVANQFKPMNTLVGPCLGCRHSPWAGTPRHNELIGPCLIGPSRHRQSQGYATVFYGIPIFFAIKINKYIYIIVQHVVNWSISTMGLLPVHKVTRRASTLPHVSLILRLMQYQFFLLMWRKKRENRARDRCFVKQPLHELN